MENAQPNARVGALESYRLVDYLPEAAYDEITFLASRICQAPISVVSLLDEKWQFFKSHYGIDIVSMPIEESFCVHAIEHPEQVMMVEDVRLDARFSDFPHVRFEPNIVFYAGAPLVTPGGVAIGTLCVMDLYPRQLNAEQLASLTCLSNQVVRLLELHKANHQLEEHHAQSKADQLEQQRAAQQMQENQEMTIEAQRMAKMGSWYLNLQTGIYYWSDALFEVYGITRGVEQYGSLLHLVHPSDRDLVAQTSAHAKQTGDSFLIEYRIITPAGENRVIKATGHSQKDDAGKPLRLYGMTQDITRQKQEGQQLRLMGSVITNTTDAVLITEAEPINDPGPRILYVNEAFTRMTGYTAEEVIGKTPRILQGPKSDKEALLRLRHAMERGESCEISTINYKKNGEEFWLNFSVSPVADAKGWFTHWIAIERDITTQKNQELQAKVVADIGQIFGQEEKLQPCLVQVLKYLVDFGEFSLAEVWLPNANNTRLHLIAHYPHGNVAAKFYGSKDLPQSFAYGEGLPGRTWKSKRLEHWTNVTENQLFLRREAAKAAGIQEVIGIPLFHNKKIMGVLVMAGTAATLKPIFYNQLFDELRSVMGVEIARKHVENELHQIFNFAPDIICSIGYDGYFKKVNPAATQLLGYSQAELLGKPMLDFIHAEDRQKASAYLESPTKGGAAQYFKVRSQTKGGHIKWLSWGVTPSPDEGIFLAVAKDVSETRELANLLEKATRLAGIGSWEIDLVNDKIFWSTITKEVHEVDPDYEPLPTTALEFYKAGPSRERIYEVVENAVKTGESWDIEVEIVTLKGNERWIRVIGDAEFVNGQCVRIYGSLQDIQSRKFAELEQLRALEEKNTILESIGDAFFAVNRHWEITYWNKVAEFITRRTRQDVLGKHFILLFPEGIGSLFFEKFQVAMQEQVTIHFEAFSNNYNIWFEVSAYPSAQGLSVYFKDVTVRKKAEDEIRETNERFAKVTEATNDAIWDWDIVNDALFLSGGFSTLFGYEGLEKTRTITTWSSRIHPEEREAVMASLFAVIDGHEGDIWQAEYRFLKYDGDYSYVIDRGIVIRNRNHVAIRMVGALSDITYRKTTEESLKQLYAQLEDHAKRLEYTNAELEQFAYIASHDLQEPLRMVTGFLSQLEKKYHGKLDDQATRYIHFAVDGARRMRQVILDLLEYSRVGKHQDRITDVDLNEVVVEVVQLQKKNMEEKHATITVDQLPIVRSVHSPMLQIFQNLIENALKYSRPDVPVEVHIKAKLLSDAWRFSVKDNGIGIEAEFYDRIFIIFQRLNDRSKYPGSGMGLAIVKKIVDQMGGKIWVESTLGQGTTFYFTIPILSDDNH